MKAGEKIALRFLHDSSTPLISYYESSASDMDILRHLKNQQCWNIKQVTIVQVLSTYINATAIETLVAADMKLTG